MEESDGRPSWLPVDPVEHAMLRGQCTIKFTGKPKPHLPPRFISQILLGWPLRDYIIKKVKKPLMEMIIATAVKYPNPTKENSKNFPLAPPLIDISDDFFTHYCNVSRLEMVKGAVKIFIDEVAHDPHYVWLFKWWLRELIKKVDSGEIDLTLGEFPNEGCWK